MTDLTEIIVGERGSGKTSELIRRSSETGVYILVANRKRASYLAKQAREMGFNIPFPITLYEYINDNFYGSSIRRDGIYIDDMDDVIHELFKKTGINAVTITKCEMKVTELKKESGDTDDTIQS